MNDGTNIIIDEDISPDNENGIIMFSHPKLLKQLSAAKKIAVDGTFSVCPKPLFQQLWILTALIQSIWIPIGLTKIHVKCPKR